jgi:hypothetical protein
MIVRYDPNSMVVLVGCFVASALAIGLPYMAIPYSSADVPGSLVTWGMLVLFGLAAAVRIADRASFLATTATLVMVAPVVVMVRVIRDTAIDPTSHNLWPVEVAIAVFLGTIVVLAGATVGTVLRLAWNKRTTVRGPAAD